MISESGKTRPRDTTLRLPRREVQWQTPCFDSPIGLRNMADLATELGLPSGLQLDQSKKRTLSNDRGWIDNLVHARTKSEIDAASYSVLKRIHDILLHHEISRLDQILKYVPVERLAIQVLLGFLASTFKAKGSLEQRDVFYAKVEARLLRDEPERATALLRGLR